MLSDCKYIELFNSSWFLGSEGLFFMIFWRSTTVSEIETDFLKGLFAIVMKAFVLKHPVD